MTRSAVTERIGGVTDVKGRDRVWVGRHPISPSSGRNSYCADGKLKLQSWVDRLYANLLPSRVPVEVEVQRRTLRGDRAALRVGAWLCRVLRPVRRHVRFRRRSCRLRRSRASRRS
jgi:hypothetical protein